MRTKRSINSPGARATVKDLAKALNMSATTVSRALRGRPGMTEKTRAAILSAAKRMGYVRNVAGAALSTGKTQSIMFVVPEASRSYSLYQMDVLQGLIDEASQHGYSVTVVPERMLPGSGKISHESLRSFRVDGAVFLLVRAKEPHWNITEPPYPVVVVNRIIDGLAADFVVAEDETGAFEATQHLIKLGHTQLAFLSGPSDNFNAIRRRCGFEKALKDYGLRADPRLIAPASSISEEGGFRAALMLLQSGRPFTGVFCGVDILAAGALQAFKRRGLRVPQDISLVGFDNDSFSALMDPPLTTIQKPRYEMGRSAGRMLIERIEGRGQGKSTVTALRTELVIRESAASCVVPRSRTLR